MKEDNFVIKYKNSGRPKSHYFNTKQINKSHIVISENKKQFLNIGALFGKKLLIDFKKFNGFIQKNKKMIEITNVITKGNKYILIEHYYDVIKLVKSILYTSINKHLLDKTFIEDKKILNKEIKKLDKAFIENGIRQKDKEYYCSMSNIKLQNVGDKITVKDFIKLSKSNSKNASKIILNVPYFSLSLNEKQILLPRNILLELISIENNKYTLVAKAKKPEQFKVFKDNKDFSIKADLYDMVGSTLSDVNMTLTVLSTKKHKGGVPFPRLSARLGLAPPPSSQSVVPPTSSQAVAPPPSSSQFETLKNVLIRLRERMKIRNNRINPSDDLHDFSEEQQENMSIIDELYKKIKKQDEAKLIQDIKIKKLEKKVTEIELLKVERLTDPEIETQIIKLNTDFTGELTMVEEDLLVSDKLKKIETVLNYNNEEHKSLLVSIINEYFYKNINVFFYIIQLLFSEQTVYFSTINLYSRLLKNKNLLFNILKTTMLEIIGLHHNLRSTKDNESLNFYETINKIISFIIDINNNIILFLENFKNIELLYTKLGSVILFNEYKQHLIKLRMMIDISYVDLLNISLHFLQEEPLKNRLNEQLVIKLLEDKFPKYFTKSITDIKEDENFSDVIYKLKKYLIDDITIIDIKKIIDPILAESYNEKKKILKAEQEEEVPDQYECPISHALMTDPVITSDGHTYERTYIEKWLKKSMKSPTTNVLLKNKELIPNIGIKKEINKYNEKHKTKYEILDSKSLILSELLDDNINERYLFYTTSKEKPQEVVIDTSSDYTNGFYFTDKPVFLNRRSTTTTFIVARVLMGNVGILSTENKSVKNYIVNKANQKEDTTYDAVFNKKSKYNEYVVYKSDQIYPEYIVTLINTNVRPSARRIDGGGDQPTSVQSYLKSPIISTYKKPGTEQHLIKQPLIEPTTEPPVEYNHTALEDYEYNQNMNEYIKYWFSEDNIERYNRSLAKLIPSYNSEDLILLYKLEEIILYGFENLLEQEPQQEPP